jgi:hypothetical protein
MGVEAMSMMPQRTSTKKNNRAVVILNVIYGYTSQSWWLSQQNLMGQNLVIRLCLKRKVKYGVWEG